MPVSAPRFRPLRLEAFQLKAIARLLRVGVAQCGKLEGEAVLLMRQIHGVHEHHLVYQIVLIIQTRPLSGVNGWESRKQRRVVWRDRDNRSTPFMMVTS